MRRLFTLLETNKNVVYVRKDRMISSAHGKARFPFFGDPMWAGKPEDAGHGSGELVSMYDIDHVTPWAEWAR